MVGIAVAVSVGGIGVCVAVADGTTIVGVAGKVVTSDGLEQPVKNRKNKIHAAASLLNFMSDWTEQDTFKFQTQA